MVMDLAVSTCSSMELELPDRLLYLFSASTRPIALRDERFELQAASLKSKVRQQPFVLTANLVLANDSMCAPGVLDMRKRPGSYRFHTMLASIGPLPPPVFSGNDMHLCNETTRFRQDAAYCLPISGRRDSPFCDGPGRMDLLTRSSSKCFASVLHLLTADVYDVLQSRDNKTTTSPLLLFQSLLGAVRSKSTLTSATNASIAYFSSSPRQRSSTLSRVQRRLWTRGYHMFRQDGDALWRVCVAPTHPLASSLYDPFAAIVGNRHLQFPHVTLHHVEAAPNAHWRVEAGGATTPRYQRIPHAKFFPLTKVQVNGVSYDTVADPQAFLAQEYGVDFLTTATPFAH
uniref:Uncharacterized protein n=1 Tax=Globisporangium ultimum (strain ATCC 200006 / CBS 805.95 / DAOM BR144) TaxID=431595 RepID=K3XBG0_GLOUD